MDMDKQPEKVYVAVGNDLQEGLGTLEWAIRNWSSQSISIVILHFSNVSMDFVYTPFGKLPSSSVNDEKLEVLRMCEQEKIDKLLFKYTAFCGKVRTEIQKIEKSEEPIQNVILGLITRFRITKLVMGITVMKSSSWKAKSSISGSFYVHKHKPDFCELFIICGGKLVFLREENEEKFGHADDEQGIMVAKMKERGSVKGWLGKKFTDNLANYFSSERSSPHPMTLSPSNTGSPEPRGGWENYAHEIENYLQWLSTSTLNIKEDYEEEEDGALSSSLLPQQAKLEISPNTNVRDKIESIKAQIEEAQTIMAQKRKEAKANIERQTRAESTISVCNLWEEELQACISKESSNQIDLKKALESTREHIYDVSSDIEESKSRLNSILELQSELSEKLQSSSSAKFNVEAQLEKAMAERTQTLQEINELRRHRDVLRRRIEFCRDREAIEMATAWSSLNYRYREFTVDEINAATDNFSERMRLKSGGVWTNVYKGVLNHTTVAIKQQSSLSLQSQEEFQVQMEFLCQIHHPHLITVIGGCPELKCTVLEYTRNGSLQDALFCNQRNRRRLNQALPWHSRIRIASEICSGLGFLHLSEPRPIIHGNLNSSNVLLDRHLVAKITGFRPTRCSDVSELCSDVGAFGVLMLQLLTGREEDVVEEVREAMEGGTFLSVLDVSAGEWPKNLGEEFAMVAMNCATVGRTDKELTSARVMRQLEEMRNKAADMVARGGGYCEVADWEEECNDVPRIFLCPIFQDVMKNPHVAADGFSYELEAIEEWLGTGHETSPMTNLRLKHKRLTPNHTLRSLIQDWLDDNNKSTSTS